ncbi:M48 family metallopeptidase [Nocardioides panacisoli]|uniref:M48 metallopeptidase family protein n=1 Tax=Nocardioides panacisoli TaxID=627624 RepID=UPI001C62FEA1|nr:M48 family metallopeptidase [Nocardioides panacisoli]QYJ05724.1 M48 family metallopeptidase [Nocardioides panacisoli]
MGLQVEVRRSRRRRRTVQARRDGDTIVVMVPDNLSRAEERAVVAEMVAKVERRERRGSRRSDADLMQRAADLSDRYLGGIARPTSVRWVGNQRSRWGSCTPDAGTIRLSERLQTMPGWVVDYVLVHELVHLIEPHHDAAFWAWVANYPHTERAKGYLMGWSDGHGVDRPPSEEGEVD